MLIIFQLVFDYLFADWVVLLHFLDYLIIDGHCMKSDNQAYDLGLYGFDLFEEF